MKRIVISTALAAVLLATSGCANGPIRQWFRGSACNSCNPPVANPFWRANKATTCPDGTCGTGVFDQNPASIPATQLNGNAPSYGPAPGPATLPSGSLYGNTDPVIPPQSGTGQ